MTSETIGVTVKKYHQQLAGLARKVLLHKAVSAEKVSFEGFSKRAEEICRGTSLMGYYFRKQQWPESDTR